MHRTTHPPTHRISRAEWLAVIGVLWIAFALRTVDLTQVPPGLHNDEVIETRIAETVADGRLAIFFPEDTGSEGLHYYWAALFIDVFGHGVYALRLPAVFLSLISLCVVWALTRRLFGPVAALTASAGFAVAFWPVAFGRIISHTIMLVPIAALASYCLWRAWHSTGRRAWLLWGLSGLWLGLSLYAYTAARVLPVIVVAFGVYVALTQPIDRRRWWTGIAVLLAVAAMVALPLGVVLWQNPELDDLYFFEIDRPLTELRRGNLEPVAQTALQTLGMFAFVGDPLPYYTIPGHAPGDVRPGASLTEQVYSQGRPVFEPIGALMLLAGMLISLRRWRQPEYAFIVLWFFLSLVPGMLSQPAPNSTRTLGSQVVVFALIGIAVAAIVARWRHPLVVAALGLLFVGNLVWTATDYFRVWPTIDTVRYWHNSGLKAVADSLQADPDTTPAAICLPDELIDERRPWWKPGWQHMRYLLNRPDLSLRYYNCVDAMVLLDGPARYAVPDAPAAAADAGKLRDCGQQAGDFVSRHIVAFLEDPHGFS